MPQMRVRTVAYRPLKHNANESRRRTPCDQTLACFYSASVFNALRSSRRSARERACRDDRSDRLPSARKRDEYCERLFALRNRQASEGISRRVECPKRPKPNGRRRARSRRRAATSCRALAPRALPPASRFPRSAAQARRIPSRSAGGRRSPRRRSSPPTKRRSPPSKPPIRASRWCSSRPRTRAIRPSSPRPSPSKQVPEHRHPPAVLRRADLLRQGLVEPFDDVIQAIGADKYYPGANDVYKTSRRPILRHRHRQHRRRHALGAQGPDGEGRHRTASRRPGTSCATPARRCRAAASTARPSPTA